MIHFMLIKQVLIFVTLVVTCVSCVSNPAASSYDSELMKFAYANCMLQYFQGKNYDVADIRNISGGIVELGNHSIDTYAEISQVVKQFSYLVETKNNIDPLLNKCFRLDESDDMELVLNTLQNQMLLSVSKKTTLRGLLLHINPWVLKYGV